MLWLQCVYTFAALYSSSSISVESIAKIKMEEELIELVRLRPALWDKSLREYCDIFRKAELWEEIQALMIEFFDSPDEVKSKWENLRDSYQRGKKKGRLSKSGDGRDAEDKRILNRYKYAKQMQFLEKNLDRQT